MKKLTPLFDTAQLMKLRAFFAMQPRTKKITKRILKYLAFNEETGRSILAKMIDTDSSSKTIDVIGIIQLLTNDGLNNEKWLADQLDQTIEKIKVHMEQVDG